MPRRWLWWLFGDEDGGAPPAPEHQPNVCTAVAVTALLVSPLFPASTVTGPRLELASSTGFAVSAAPTLAIAPEC